MNGFCASHLGNRRQSSPPLLFPTLSSLGPYARMEYAPITGHTTEHIGYYIEVFGINRCYDHSIAILSDYTAVLLLS